jgi:hypothetical protein
VTLFERQRSKAETAVQAIVFRQSLAVDQTDYITAAHSSVACHRHINREHNDADDRNRKLRPNPTVFIAVFSDELFEKFPVAFHLRAFRFMAARYPAS